MTTTEAPAASEERKDRGAVLGRPGPGLARIIRVLEKVGVLLMPLAAVLFLGVLALPLIAPAAAAALIAYWFGIKGLGSIAAGAALATIAVIVLLPPARTGLARYYGRFSDVSYPFPFLVTVKAGEVAYLRLRSKPVPPETLPTWRFAELEGPGVFLVRGSREVIWNGTPASYEQWLRETDLASL